MSSSATGLPNDKPRRMTVLRARSACIRNVLAFQGHHLSIMLDPNRSSSRWTKCVA